MIVYGPERVRYNYPLIFLRISQKCTLNFLSSSTRGLFVITKSETTTFSLSASPSLITTINQFPSTDSTIDRTVLPLMTSPVAIFPHPNQNFHRTLWQYLIGAMVAAVVVVVKPPYGREWARLFTPVNYIRFGGGGGKTNRVLTPPKVPSISKIALHFRVGWSCCHSWIEWVLAVVKEPTWLNDRGSTWNNTGCCWRYRVLPGVLISGESWLI